MNSQSNKKRIDFTEIVSGLNDNISQADPLREAGLQTLLKVRRAKLSGQTRELDRLSQKLGEKHARVIAMTKKIETEQILIREVAVNLERSQIGTPVIDENTWVLHGRVYSKEIKGVPNLTVGLYDQKGKWLEQFGYVCTDKTGYFKLTHKFVAEKSTASSESKSDTVTPEQHRDIFIRLQDKTGIQVYIGKQPITLPVPDKVEYREIMLGDESDSCKPPEPSVKPPISRAKKY